MSRLNQNFEQIPQFLSNCQQPFTAHILRHAGLVREVEALNDSFSLYLTSFRLQKEMVGQLQLGQIHYRQTLKQARQKIRRLENCILRIGEGRSSLLRCLGLKCGQGTASRNVDQQTGSWQRLLDLGAVLAAGKIGQIRFSEQDQQLLAQACNAVKRFHRANCNRYIQRVGLHDFQRDGMLVRKQMLAGFAHILAQLAVIEIDGEPAWDWLRVLFLAPHQTADYSGHTVPGAGGAEPDLVNRGVPHVA